MNLDKNKGLNRFKKAVQIARELASVHNIDTSLFDGWEKKRFMVVHKELEKLCDNSTVYTFVSNYSACYADRVFGLLLVDAHRTAVEINIDFWESLIRQARLHLEHVQSA